jgi:protein-S-isoprenylcysteine O-methyltransferase Ste14
MAKPKPSSIDRRISPVVLGLVLAAAMWYVPDLGTSLDRALDVPLAVRAAVGASLAFAGLLAVLAAVVSFRSARTTVNPFRSAQETALVTSGVFRFSRNPMYLGACLGLVALACVLARPVTLFGPIVFVVWMNTFQIPPEERALRERFGAVFDDYAARVRRWI